MKMRPPFPLILAALVASLWFAPSADAAYATVSTCHVTAASTNQGAVTTSAINCSGADLLVVSISYYSGGGGTSNPSDSSGNTWSLARSQTQAGACSAGVLKIFYVQAPTTSSSQTFTASATGGSTAPSIQVQGFTGSGSSPLDQVNSATSGSSNVSTIQPNSITPTVNNELVVSDAFFCSTGNTLTIDSGFSTPAQNTFNSSTNEGGAFSYLIQTTAAAVNPTWTLNTAANIAAAVASFKPSGGVSVTPVRARRGYGE